MTLFGAEYRWMLRISQASCAIVCATLALGSVVLWNAYPGIAILSGLCGAFVATIAFTIHMALRNIEQREQQKKSDSADIADLARSAVTSTRKSVAEAAVLPSNFKLVIDSVKNCLVTQTNRANSLREQAKTIADISAIIAETSGVFTSNYSEVLKSQGKLRKTYSDLKTSTQTLLTSQNQAQKSLQDLARCKTSVINLGIELASIVGDHPEFFSSANETINRIDLAIDSVRQDVARTIAPAGDLMNSLETAAISTEETDKHISKVGKIDELLNGALDLTKLCSNSMVLSNLAGVEELETLAREAHRCDVLLKDFVSAQQQGDLAAVRAVTAIDRFASRKPTLRRTAEVYSTSQPHMQTPTFSAEKNRELVSSIAVDLSPAHERAKYLESKDNIEIAS